MHNLNRVKRILSAQLGTEVPKPFYTLNGKFFLDGKEVTKEDYFKDSRVINDYEKFKEGLLKHGVNSLKSLESTLDTTIENSSNYFKKLLLTKDDIKALNVASYELNAVDIVAPKPKSLNDGLKTEPVPITLPEKLEVPAKLVEEQKSAGMKFKEEYEAAKQAKREKIAGTIGKIGTDAFLAVGQAVGAQQAAIDSTLTKGANALYNTAAGVVENLGPIGKIVGVGMKNAALAGDIIQGLGGGTDQMTTTDKWMDSSFFSWNIGMLNGFGGKKADSFAADRDILASVGSSYGGTTEDINNAATKASKKYGLFSSGARRKANRAIADARAKLNLMGDISEEATDLRLNAQSMGEQAGLAYSLMTDGGYNLKYTYAAKEGGTLEWNPVITLECEPKIELNLKLPEFKEGGELPEGLEWVPEFKKGGKTSEMPEIEETVLKNLIPEGALHKNKHHMEHAEGLTKKGIPVVDEEGKQQAEIEHSEIIFTLKVTKRLEEYYEIFYSDDSTNKEKEQAALDAGKLLVYQILENTDDRTGLIESCKKGGSLTLKKSTDDLIEEVLEWMPTVVIIEEEKSKENHKNTEKELMKEAIKEVLIELLTK